MNKPRHTRAEIAKAITEAEIIALGYSYAYARKLIEARIIKKRGY